MSATRELQRRLRAEESQPRFALNMLREDAASSLNAACGLLDKGRLTQDAIDLAREAVAAWLNALPTEAS